MFQRIYQIRTNVDVASLRPRFVVPREVGRLGSVPSVNLSGVSDRYTLHAGFAIQRQTSGMQLPHSLLQVSTENAECSPCVDFVPATSTSGAVVLTQNGLSWATTMSVAVSSMLNTEHLFVVASLEGRLGSVRVYRGVNSSGTLLGEDHVESPGDSAAHSDAVVYFGSTRAGAPFIARGFVHSASFEVLGTLLGGALGFWPTIDSAVLVLNAIQFRGNRTSLRSSKLRFSQFNDDPVLSADGPGGQRSVCFSGSSGLVHPADSRFTPQTSSSCAWFKQVDAYSTIFPTIVDGPTTLHKYAFSDDVALGSGDLYGADDLRASHPSDAEPVFGTWNLLCGTRSASRRQLFLNSTLVASDDAGGLKGGLFGVGATTDPTVLNTSGVTRSTRGCVSDPILWKRELSLEDVQSVFTLGVSNGIV